MQTQPDQNKRDRVILDLIDELLKPEPPPYVPQIKELRRIASVGAITAYILMMVLGVATLALYALAFTLDREVGISEFLMALLGGCGFYIGYLMIRQATGINIAREQQIQMALEHDRGIHRLRAEQRLELLQAMTPVQIAESAHRSQYTAQDLAHAQRREEQDFELRVLDKKLRIEHPNAEDKARDREIHLNSTITVVDLLNEMDASNDPKMKRRAQQLWKMMEDGKL